MLHCAVFIQDILDQCWTPCVCKMGKMAEYARHQQPPASSSPRHVQPPPSTSSSSLRFMDTLSDISLDPITSFVQLDTSSEPSSANNSYISNRLTSREDTINSDLYISGQRKSSLARSISVDETDTFHFIPKNRSADSSVFDGQIDSYCETDVPFNISKQSYSKNTLSHKIFGSYNPFEKFSTKSGTSSSSKCRKSYNSPVRRGNGAARQDSLDCNTIEMLSPILEQEKLCTDCQSWRSLVMIIAVRLGGDSFNTIYERVIKALLRHPLCIGLVGGKAKRAFYFVGYQGKKQKTISCKYIYSLLSSFSPQGS